MLNGCVFKMDEYNRDFCLIINPSSFNRSSLVSSKSEVAFTLRPSLTVLLRGTYLSQSPQGHLTLIPKNCCQF